MRIKSDTFKVKAKNICIPVVAMLLMASWVWVLNQFDDMALVMKSVIAIAFSQFFILRINEGAIQSIKVSCWASFILCVISVYTQFLWIPSLVLWIGVTIIFYCQAIWTNVRVLLEIRKRRRQLYS